MRGSTYSPSTLSRLLLVAVLLPVTLASESQEVFRYPLDSDVFLPRKAFDFEWPVKRVAIIGAGVGGMTAYRELKQDGFDVHVFERDDLPGGTWHYTEEVPVNVPIPNVGVEVADFEPVMPPVGRGEELPYVEECGERERGCRVSKREHRAPRAIWFGLSTNTPAPLQQIRGFSWPEGTEWAVPQAKVGRYLRSFASWNGINTNDNSPDVSYSTRVELVEKRLDTSGKQIGWTLLTTERIEYKDKRGRTTWDKHDFDAVVVASGRYNGPYIPPIEGLESWGKLFPEAISHSRQYRRPEYYAGKRVVVVGAAASGAQISREMSRCAAKIYQSVRPERNAGDASQRPVLADWIRQLPSNISVVAEIKRFHSPNTTIQESAIELVDGTILSGIDHILFATGFRYSYPFLPEYHNSALGRTGEAPEDGLQPIITDGSHLRSLHLDTFYIDNPTLAFVNANFEIPAFTYPEFQSLAISKVWAGEARLPTREEMWRLYRQKVDVMGYGKQLSFLGKRVQPMLRFFRGWLNAAADKYGGRQIDGLPFELTQISSVWTRAQVGDPWLVRNVTIPGVDADVSLTGDEADMDDYMYNDHW